MMRIWPVRVSHKEIIEKHVQFLLIHFLLLVKNKKIINIIEIEIREKDRITKKT